MSARSTKSTDSGAKSSAKPGLSRARVAAMAGATTTGVCESGLPIQCGECYECLFNARVKATTAWFTADLGLQRLALGRLVSQSSR